MLEFRLMLRLFYPKVVFESVVMLALILYVELEDKGDMLRGGIAEGMELLETSGCPNWAMYGRKGTRVLREILAKVEKESSASRARATSRESGRDSGSPSPSIEEPQSHAAKVDNMLANIKKEQLSWEYLLRETDWGGAWEKVLSWM